MCENRRKQEDGEMMEQRSGDLITIKTPRGVGCHGANERTHDEGVGLGAGGWVFWC